MTELPEAVAAATEVAGGAGFIFACEPETGRLLAVLAAAVPRGGRILELGTGTGVGTAWIAHGLGARTDAEVVTVDIDPETAELAARTALPSYVRRVVGDAVEVTAREGAFDLIFADAQGGKWHGLDVTVAALKPGATLLVDDMTPPKFHDAEHEQKTAEVNERLLAHPALLSVPIAWSTGLILSTRRHPSPA